ncbi:MAG: hypothetical protein LBE80_05720, partial [Deltaproteobacteria bacterium]|nr:hypothetical protein [Deltaproteobacteria bacterium]
MAQKKNHPAKLSNNQNPDQKPDQKPGQDSLQAPKHPLVNNQPPPKPKPKSLTIPEKVDLGPGDLVPGPQATKAKPSIDLSKRPQAAAPTKWPEPSPKTDQPSTKAPLTSEPAEVPNLIVLPPLLIENQDLTGPQASLGPAQDSLPPGPPTGPSPLSSQTDPPNQIVLWPAPEPPQSSSGSPVLDGPVTPPAPASRP